MLTVVAAAIEVATGIVLMVAPSAFARVLLGTGLSSAGQAVGRIAGFALLSLGLACWPKDGPAAGATAGALASPALLIYNLLITLYLAYVGIAGELVGTLLWPAVALHAVLSAILIHARFFKTKSGRHSGQMP